MVSGGWDHAGAERAAAAERSGRAGCAASGGPACGPQLIAAVRPGVPGRASSPSTPATRYSGARSAGWLPARGRRAGGRGLCAASPASGGPLRAGLTWTRSSRRPSPRWHKQEPAGLLPGTGLRVRRQPPGAVHASRRGVGTCRTPGLRKTGSPACRDRPAARPAGLPDQRSAACGPSAASPFCHAHGATWKVNGRPEPGGFAARYLDDHPVRVHERIIVDSLPRAAEAGGPVRAPAAVRRARGQGPAVRRDDHGAVPGRQRGVLAAGPDRAGMAGSVRQEEQRDRAAGLVPPGGHRPGRGQRLGRRVSPRRLADAPPRLRGQDTS